MKKFVVARWLAVTAVLLGCSDSKSATGPESVTYSITITAPDSTLLNGRTSQLTATLTRSDGLPTYSATVVWSSSDNNIATLDVSGLLTAKAPGSVTVTASAKGASANTQIRILPTLRDQAAKIVAESVYVGMPIDLRVSIDPTFADGTTWTSSDPTVGTVDGGVFTALKRGISTVTATRGEKVSVVDVLAQTRVKALRLAPDTLEIEFPSPSAFDVVATDSAGKRIFGRSIAWSVANTSMLTSSRGVLTPRLGGTTTVTAVSEGVSATGVVRVTAPSTYTVYLTAPKKWVSVGETLPLTSAAHNPLGFFFPNPTLVWSSSDSSIARVSPTGAVTGVAPGTATIAADVPGGGHKGTFDVRVEAPVASIVFAPDTVFLFTLGSQLVSPSLRDANGSSLSTRELTWTSSNPNVVTVAPTFTLGQAGDRVDAGATAGEATLTASVDGVSATLKAIVTPGTELLRFDFQVAGAGTYVAYDIPLYLQDPKTGLISGRAVRLVSNNPAVLSVQPDTATFVNGLVMVHVTTGRAGYATVTATSGSLSATYLVHVAPVDVTVKIAVRPAELAVGTTYRLTTTAYQYDGARHIIDWTSSDPSVATVSDSGVVTALAGGVVRIVARARDGLGAAADSVTITVRAPQSPVVASVSPTELRPGGSATITGQNFSATPSANAVTIDGVPVQVTAATATQLDIAIPASASFPCRPTHRAPLVVSTGPGLVAVSQQMLASAPQQSLAVGDATFWSPAACNELAKGRGSYLLTVSNGGTRSSAPAGFSFMVDTGSVASGIVASRGPIAGPGLSRSIVPSAPRGAPAPGVLPINMDSVRRAAIAHRDLLERSRKLASTVGSPLASLRRAARTDLSLNVVTTSQAVPDTGTRMFVRVPRLDTPEFCSDYRTIHARVVYTGPHSIILEDLQSPLAGTMDSYYQSVGAEFDQKTYDVIAGSFGDPMAMSRTLGSSGRVTMLFTPAVNAMGPTGFVVSCDFYPAASVPSSNQREMFYAVVPTSNGTGFNGQFTPDVWRHIIRGTIAHETKHIASMAERFARQAPQLEDSWLEEGTAMHAMELWARTVTSMKWKGASGYRSALYCDVRPTEWSCNNQPYTMFDHFAYLHDFLTARERYTPLGATDPSDASVYGSAWWLVRWSVDQYATDEGAFFRALTQEPVLTGVANLSARTGRNWPDLVRDWSLATMTSYFSPSVPLSDTRLTTPSWKLRDVFDGMRNDFPSFGLVDWNRQYCASPPTVVRALPPGGISFFYIDTCEGWKNFFRFQSDAGGTPSSALSIKLVRIQ